MQYIHYAFYNTFKLGSIPEIKLFKRPATKMMDNFEKVRKKDVVKVKHAIQCLIRVKYFRLNQILKKTAVITTKGI